MTVTSHSAADGLAMTQDADVLSQQSSRAPLNLTGGTDSEPFEFNLPSDLEAGEPPEARGLARDEVRLMVSYAPRVTNPDIGKPNLALQDTVDVDIIRHTQFRHLPDFLDPGDLVVVNTSGTLNAAIDTTDSSGKTLELHLSTQLPGGIWTVELREPFDLGTKSFRNAQPGEILRLAGGGTAVLHAPYSCGCDGRAVSEAGRLWLATFEVAGTVIDYFEHNGFPIRYSYVRDQWPAAYYQTVYATEPGSAEMPSAGRAFTADLVTRLVARGIQIAPLILHTGVASVESSEPPYEEFYRIPRSTARQINAARATGARIIAVGTTVVRALETVTTSDGETYPGEGWTCHVVGPTRPIRSVTGLLTGFHEPKSSHLQLLEGFVSRNHLRQTYRAALDLKYLWHEFGDLHLILGSRA